MKECEEAFENFKKKLMRLPILSPSRPRQPLILYVAKSNSSINAVLVSEKRRKPNTKPDPTTFPGHSKESNTSRTEKLALAVVATIR